MCKIRINCGICGKFDWRYPSQIKETNYCSRKCASINAGRSTAKPELWIERHCLYCNSTFEVLKSVIAKGYGKFCSSSCSAYYHKSRGKFVYTKGTKKLYPNTLELRRKICRKRSVKELKDNYIKDQLNQTTSLEFTNIPKELINLKRKQLKLHRLTT